MSMPEQPLAATAVAYCRTCGTPVYNATLDQISQGLVYCAQHAPIAAAAPPPMPPPPTAGGPNPWVTPAAVPPYPVAASPALAFMLGFIPGVGAVYNGQYGKGLLHALITGLLITLISQTDQEPLLGIMLGAWVFYMAFEAMHTARRRMLGIPVDEFSSLLPNRADGKRSIVAPMLLMGIGVILLLNNFQILPLQIIVRFWPVGLILVGAYLLYSRLVGPAPRSGGL